MVAAEWGGLLPRLSRDSGGNNEKLWRDFKANARSFPVVMSDSEEALLPDKAAGTHALSHTFLLPTKPWTGCVPLPLCSQGKKTFFCKEGKEPRSLLLSMTSAVCRKPFDFGIRGRHKA